MPSFPKPPLPAALRAAEALWGEPPREPSKPKTRLLSFRAVIKNSLRDFATVALPNGLIINDVSLLVSHGKAWASLPSKPLVERDGQPKLDPRGKPSYAPIVVWADDQLRKRLSDALVTLVRTAHRGALDDGGVP